MFIAMMIWVGVMVLSTLFNIYLLHRIEKSGVKRWGATGKLFKY